MTVTVTLERDLSAPTVSTRQLHQTWLALTAEGLTVLALDARLAARVQVQAANEVDALELVRDAYRQALAA
jgi:hypothetical protein